MNTEPDYLDELVLQLRLLDVPGEQIGEYVAEAESHLADSGETPETAFGPVRDYARELASRDGRTLPRQTDSDNIFVQLFASMEFKDWMLVGVGLLATFVGAYLLFNGIFALTTDSAPLFGLPPLLLTVIGLVLLLSWIGWTRSLPDPIVDPRTGKRVGFDRKGRRDTR